MNITVQPRIINQDLISPRAFGRSTTSPTFFIFRSANSTELHAKLLLFSRRSIHSSFVYSPLCSNTNFFFICCTWEVHTFEIQLSATVCCIHASPPGGLLPGGKAGASHSRVYRIQLTQDSLDVGTVLLVCTA